MDHESDQKTGRKEHPDDRNALQGAFIGALIGMVLVSRNSDRTARAPPSCRAFPCFACAAGLLRIGMFANTPALTFAALLLLQWWAASR
jgi:prolipoprotein diacylglyceryltransferase